MTKHKRPLSDAERAAELAKMDLRPESEALKRADELLRSMLNSPPEPFTPKAPKKRAKK